MISIACCACSTAPIEHPPTVRQAISTCLENAVAVCVCGLDEGTQVCHANAFTPCDCGTADAGDAGSRRPPPPPTTPALCGDAKVGAGLESCPGEPIAIRRGCTLAITGTTLGSSNDLKTTCGPSVGPDRVYGFTAPEDGVLHVSAQFGFSDPYVSVREDGCDAPAFESCVSSSGPSVNDLQFDVRAGHVYSLVVDSESAGGTYALTIVLQ